MAHLTESSGEIEIISLSPRLQAFVIGYRVQLIFKPIDLPNPPYQLKVWSPSGKTIVDTIIRSLPTGEPQSAAPFEFLPTVNGIYKIRLSEMKGRAYGEGKLQVG
jgi:hypothetical protein